MTRSASTPVRSGPIVLGYAGTLDQTVAIPWLRDTERAEVVAVIADLGQRQDLEAVRDRALAAGAVRAHVLDVGAEFARSYVLPALRAGALDDGASVRALEAPIVARTLVEVCGIEQAAAIAHCATGASRTRLEAALLALAASASVLAPAASWRMTRADRVEYARLHHAPWSETPEDGDPTPRAAADPKEPASVDIRFDRGAPLALNGIDMPLSDLLDTLATIAGAHGIEAPAAAVLQAAHDSLIGGVADLARFRSLVTREYRDIVLGGRWFSPLRQALDAFVTAAADRVSGVVRLTLFKGEARTAVVDRTPGPRVIAVEARA